MGRLRRVCLFPAVCIAALSGMLSGCGGGGGGGGNASSSMEDNAPPSAHAGPDQTVVSGALVTLNGAASTDADGIVSAFSWSQTLGPQVVLSNPGSVNPSFTAPVVTETTLLRFALMVQDNAGAASAAADSVDINVQPQAPTATVTISGTITYARVPFHPLPGTGLNFAHTRQDPSRGITVQAVDPTNLTVLASGVTDENGRYSLSVPAERNVAIRAVAELVRQAPEPLPRWRVSVSDLGRALTPYSFMAATFNTGTGVTDADVAIPSGWNTATRQPDGPRHAAPFAILDTIYLAHAAILAVAPEVDFPELMIDWAPNNPGGQTFYFDDAGGPRRHIVLSGESDADIDEYDPHTIAHEFGHYVEDQFSRSDSIGGPHSFGQLLDPRVAFGEGFGYAFAAIVLNDPIVRDAAGPGQASEGRFSVDLNATPNPGWFSEASVQEILWDLYDSGVEPHDQIELGFGPLWSIFTSEQRSTDAATTIFSFITALKQAQPAAGAAIDQLVNAEIITSLGMDAFGSTEGNDAGSPDVLPIYTPVTVGGGPVMVRSVTTFDSGNAGNKLSVHRFLKLDLPAPQSVRITAQSAQTGRDIDVLVFRNGSIVAAGMTLSTEDFTASLAEAGTYVLDVFDCANAACGPGTPGPIDITVTVAPN